MAPERPSNPKTDNLSVVFDGGIHSDAQLGHNTFRSAQSLRFVAPLL